MKNSIILVIAMTISWASYAQISKDKTPTIQSDTLRHANYACPMHPEITSKKPGKCPKCGMDLIKQKKYSCPMHPAEVSNQPGKCPVCGMDLMEIKPKSKKG